MISKACRNISCLHILLFITVASIVLLDIRFHLQTHDRLDHLDEDRPLLKNGEHLSARNVPKAVRRQEDTQHKHEDTYIDESSETPDLSSWTKVNQNISAKKFRRIAPHDMPPETKSDWSPSDSEVPVNRFPKSLLVGFSKCGTSSLLAFLNVHPQIVTLDWETDYFCDRVYFKYSLHWYRMRMPLSTSKQITIEKSPCYISERQALERIRGFNSSMKIMVILRDPLTRIKSQHGQYLASFKASDKPKQSIEERYMNVQSGKLYEQAVKKWGIFTSRMEHLYDIFPREQIYIIDGDRFVRDPLPVMSGIEQFLGLQPYFTDQDIHYNKEKGFYCPRYRATKETECMGYQKGRPHVEMSDKLRRALQKYIRPHSERLFGLINRRMNWDLAS